MLGRTATIVAAGWMLAGSGPAPAQTGNPVQDAINRDMINQAILRQANGGRDYKGPKPPASSPLYGHWLPMNETNQLAKSGVGHDLCSSAELAYTPTTEMYVTRQIGPYPAERKVHRVTYVRRDARSLYVVPEGSTVGGYVEIIDKDHIRPEAADQCIYRRAG